MCLSMRIIIKHGSDDAVLLDGRNFHVVLAGGGRVSGSRSKLCTLLPFCSRSAASILVSVRRGLVQSVSLLQKLVSDLFMSFVISLLYPIFALGLNGESNLYHGAG